MRIYRIQHEFSNSLSVLACPCISVRRYKVGSELLLLGEVLKLQFFYVHANNDGAVVTNGMLDGEMTIGSCCGGFSPLLHLIEEIVNFN